MSFKEELQTLIYKHLLPTSTAKDYGTISEVLHSESDRLDCEAELFYFGWDEEAAYNNLESDDAEAPYPTITQAEAGIVPGSEYNWSDLLRLRELDAREMGKQS